MPRRHKTVACRVSWWKSIFTIRVLWSLFLRPPDTDSFFSPDIIIWLCLLLPGLAESTNLEQEAEKGLDFKSFSLLFWEVMLTLPALIFFFSLAKWLLLISSVWATIPVTAHSVCCSFGRLRQWGLVIECSDSRGQGGVKSWARSWSSSDPEAVVQTGGVTDILARLFGFFLAVPQGLWILFPWPGIEPGPMAVKALSPNTRPPGSSQPTACFVFSRPFLTLINASWGHSQSFNGCQN